VDHEPLLRALGCDEHRVRAGELWTLLLENLRLPEIGPGTRLGLALQTILGRGPLARRILRATGPRPSPERIGEVWQRLAECLLDGRLFVAQ
jgi:hypothetical protein